MSRSWSNAPLEAERTQAARDGAAGPIPSAHRVRQLQSAIGNRAVARLLSRTPSHPMAKELQVAEGLNEQGLIDAVDQSITNDLTRSDNKLRTTQLGYLRAVQAFMLSPHYSSRKQQPTALMSKTDMDKLVERKWIEGTIATAGSLRLGSERAAKSKSPHNAEQMQLLRGDIKFVQEQFASRVRTNAYAFLDDSERRIASVLRSYGLVTAAAGAAVSKVFLSEGELDNEVDTWLERARIGQKARYESKAAVDKRGSLAKTIQGLRALQANALKLQVGYINRFGKIPLDEADRRKSDKRQKGVDDPVAKAIIGNQVTPLERSKEEEIQTAGRALSAAWIKAEREHPVLAAHRDGQQRHLEFIDLTSYGESYSPGGHDFLDAMNIVEAYKKVNQKTEQSTHERAVVKQALRKLVNIHRTRLALQQGKLSFYKLKPVVDFTRTQLLIHPRSVWGVAVDEVVSPYKGLLEEGFEFVKDVFNIAMMALAAIPTPVQPIAVMYDVARGVYTTMDEYVKYDLQTAYSDTDLDKARSISDEEPSLTGFVVSLIATGMGVAQARSVFKAAAAARRSMLAGDDAARQALNDLGEAHGVRALGDDLARESGIARGGAPSNKHYEPDDLGKGAPKRSSTAGPSKPPRNKKATSAKEAPENDRQTVSNKSQPPTQRQPSSNGPTFGNIRRDTPNPAIKRVELKEENGQWYEIDPDGTTRPAQGGIYKFVVKDGKIYAGAHGAGHHTDAALGSPVSFAGEVHVDASSGRVLSWNGDSGHYRPAEFFRENAIRAGLPADRFTRVPGTGYGKRQLPVQQPPTRSRTGERAKVPPGPDRRKELEQRTKSRPTPSGATSKPPATAATGKSGETGWTPGQIQDLFTRTFKRPGPATEAIVIHRTRSEYDAALRATGLRPDTPGFYSHADRALHLPPDAPTLVVIHEALHSVGHQTGVLGILGGYVDEGLTEWLVRLELGPHAARVNYDAHHAFVKLLANEVGADTLRMAYLHGEWSALRSKLAAKVGDEARVETFFSLLRQVEAVGTSENGRRALERAMSMLWPDF
jgi:hypothetical protein